MKQANTSIHTKQSLARQILVSISMVVAIVGGFIGSGAAGGTEIQNASNGALASDATFLAPDGPAFTIWSVIYVGFLSYAVWQFMPRQRNQERHRRLCLPVSLSLLLNAAWILSIQYDQLWLSVPIILLLLAVLIWTFALLQHTPPTSKLDAIITDGTFGLYLGWVSVAATANIAAWFVAENWSGLGIRPTLWSIFALVLTVVLALALAYFGKGRLAPALSVIWGLGWLAAARTSGNLESLPVAIAAVTGAVAVAFATIVWRRRTKL